MSRVTQAVVLAAGRGTRFAPLTDFMPKPAVEVAGLPLIVRVLRSLPSFITRVVIVVGYKGDVIRGMLGDVFEGRDLVYVAQPHQTGTASAFLCAKPHLDLEQPTLVAYGDDLVCPESWIELCALNEAGLLVSPVMDESLARTLGLVALDEDGCVSEVREKVKEPDKLPLDLLASCGGMLLDAGLAVEVLETARVTPDQPLPQGASEHVFANFIRPMGAKLRQLGRPGIRTTRVKFWFPINTPAQRRVAEGFFLGLE